MSANPTTTTFRDMVYAISPSWLRGFIGYRFMYSMAIQFDAIADAAAYAVRARFPDLAPPDALPFLSNDRQIFQGFQEPTSNYIQRLIQWLDRHAKRGSPWGLLMAIRGYLAIDPGKVETITNSGAWDYYFGLNSVADINNPPFHAPPSASYPWNWDNASGFYMQSYAWWRVWVVIYIPNTVWSLTTRKFGDGSTWGSGFTYGCTCTPDQAQSLRNVIAQWKSANTWVPWIIFASDPLSFDPQAGSVLPDGTWGAWSKIVANPVSGRPLRVIARVQTAAYAVGTT